MNEYGEPWQIKMGDYAGDEATVYNIMKANGELIVETDMGAYPPELPEAARIVACVNACAGMEDPVKEVGRLQAIDRALDDARTRDYP